jgi:amidase
LDAVQGPDVGAPLEIAPPTIAYRDEVRRDPGRLRIGFTTRPLLEAEVHSDCVAAVEDAAALLHEMGHAVEEASPTIEGYAFTRAFLTMVAAELGADLEDFRATWGRRAQRDKLEEPTWALALLSKGISARDYATALRVLERTGRAVGHFFRDYDALLTPTLAFPPPPIGSIGPSKRERLLLGIIGAFGSGRLVSAAGLLDKAALDAFSFTPWAPIFNVTGQPAMSVPLRWNDAGLPIGVHLVGRFGREDVLFRLAGRLEEARPWFGRLAPLARALD